MKNEDKDMIEEVQVEDVNESGENGIVETRPVSCDIPMGFNPGFNNDLLGLFGSGLLNSENSSSSEPDNKYRKIEDVLRIFDTGISEVIDEYLMTGKFEKSHYEKIKSMLVGFMGSSEEAVKLLEAYVDDIKQEANSTFKATQNSLAINILVDVMRTRLDNLVPTYKDFMGSETHVEEDEE